MIGETGDLIIALIVVCGAGVLAGAVIHAIWWEVKWPRR